MPYKDLEKQRKWWRVRRTKIRTIVDEAKNKPCVDCGNIFPVICMQFDHVKGIKSFNLASAKAYGGNLEKLYAEIHKCDIVCANCHAIRTDRRRKKNDDLWARE
jgi:hypothetical protein